MRDAISGLIGRYDQLGRYFDRSAIDSIEDYLSESGLRIQAVELINREAAEIVREASQRLFRDEPELLLPGGNAYTTRRLAACLRDMDYFLRYASYALVAGDTLTRPVCAAQAALAKKRAVHASQASPQRSCRHLRSSVHNAPSWTARPASFIEEACPTPQWPGPP